MTPQLVTAQTLRDAIAGQTGVLAELADAGYYLVSAEWLDGPFASGYYDFLNLFGLLDWKPETNDCDKFSGWATSVATALHARTAQKMGLPPGGLAWGVWRYKPDWSPTRHSINWFAYGVPVSEQHPEGIAIGYFECNGRQRLVVKLSDPEIISCFQCAN